MMTRKDFQELAGIVSDFHACGEVTYATKWWAEALADFCKTQNPRFDRDKFYRACGLEEMADN